MDEGAIVKALADQWPIVTVILLTFFRGASSALAYLREFERKVDEALKAQVEHGRRIEQGFEGIAVALRQGVVELRDRTAHHDRVLGELGAEVSGVKGRLEDLERSSILRAAPTQPLRPVQ